MININDLIQKKRQQFGIDDPNFRVELSLFFVSNNWFGHPPVPQDGTLMLSEEMVHNMEHLLDHFCENYGMDDRDKTVATMEAMSRVLPNTTELFKRYIKTVHLDMPIALHTADFMYSYMPGELPESTDGEVKIMMEKAFDELPRVFGNALSDFVNWVHNHTRTVYQSVYFMNKYADNSQESAAYDPHHYLDILYHLYNEKYIEENDMYALAAESKNYVDTWLFLALHFLCALRTTDMIRLPHPRLTDEPKKVLEQIKEGTFSAESAKATVYSIIYYLNAFLPTPNKTQGTKGVGSIKLTIPTSIENHIGTLFAAAEAHFQLSGKSPDEPLIRVITRYEDISRYMGEEIGDLFLESNFRSRSANKAYMQMIYLLTDDILEINDEFHVKGYVLASLARSHKGSYGDYAKTTSVYLKDAKMNGFSPEFVAKELFERGVLSCIPSMLLKMICGDGYDRLSVENQTRISQELGLSPLEVERSVQVSQQNMKRSKELVTAMYQSNTREDLLKILHRIGNGDAVARNDSCLCLMTAMGKMCPKPECANCPSCEYELSTKTTMLLMTREFFRLKDRFSNCDVAVEKERSKELAEDIVLPCIEEMLSVMQEMYGLETVKALELIVAQESKNA